MRISEPVPYLIDAKPAMEWLLGAPVQKASPLYSHALLQRVFAEELGRWSQGRGRVGIEWRLWLTPPGEAERYLVPDVAFVSFERLGREAPRATIEEPHVAPDVVVEILSPRDRNVLVQHKPDVYLRCNVKLVVVVDPLRRSVVLHDRERSEALASDAVLVHPAVPGLEIALGAVFAKMDE